MDRSFPVGDICFHVLTFVAHVSEGEEIDWQISPSAVGGGDANHVIARNADVRQ